jgi:hypothetical protein
MYTVSKKTSRSQDRIHPRYTTYQLGIDFIETNQSLLRPQNLSRISALTHTPLELVDDQIHLFRVASASGREGTKARLGAYATQARRSINTSELTIRAFGNMISAEITAEEFVMDAEKIGTGEVSLSAYTQAKHKQKCQSYLLIRLCNLLMA